MPWCRKSKTLRPVRQYMGVENGRCFRCAVFCMGRRDVPALLRWLNAQAAPVLGLRRGEDGRVTVVLGAQPKEETNGERTMGAGGAFPSD